MNTELIQYDEAKELLKQARKQRDLAYQREYHREYRKKKKESE